MRNICLLGASGSIGKQTIDVLLKHRDDFKLLSFSVGHHTRCIFSLIKRFPEVKSIYLIDKKKAQRYQNKYPHINFFYGEEMLFLINNDVDMVVNALVGFVGLKPTLYALEQNKIVCLANKEALVVGGELVNQLLEKGQGILYPIDSEHSAIKKCLMVDNQDVDKIVLTASGGAFRDYNREQLKNVTKEDALKHPTWKMGQKITIDCATMINKAFEVIEAHYLFNYPYDKIGIKLHDESHVHSYVEYHNGLMRLDVSKPDMRNPIKLALYEYQIPFDTKVVESLDDLKGLHFHDFNPNRYPIVDLAKIVIEKKGGYGAVFNASNEVAVKAFLNDEIPFLAIEEIVKECMDKYQNENINNYEQLQQIDQKTRQIALELVKKWRKQL